MDINLQTGQQIDGFQEEQRKKNNWATDAEAEHAVCYALSPSLSLQNELQKALSINQTLWSSNTLINGLCVFIVEMRLAS